MQYTIYKNIVLIINPVAGRKKARKAAFEIAKLFYEHGYRIAAFTTFEKNDAINIVRDNCAAAQKILCCGGDGTLNEVITGLAISKMKIPIGYIPTGTTNDLARAIGLPIKIKKAIYNAVHGSIRKHDIGTFNENQYFSYVASFGAFTKVSYTTPQKIKNLIGHAAYIFHGLISIADIKPYKVTVTADGREITGDFIYGGVSNSTVFGGVFKLPKSEISFNDGLFEVILVKNPTTPKDLRSLVHNVVNQQYDERYIYFLKAKEVSFTFDVPTAWTTDGEYAGSHNNVYIVNKQSAAEFIATPSE